MNQKGFSIILIIAIAVVALTGGFFVYKNLYTSAPKTEQIPNTTEDDSNSFWDNDNPDQKTACTMEAKVCPDGSSVGRTGSNCEFASCPDETADWKTYTNTQYGFEIKYPSNWQTIDDLGPRRKGESIKTISTDTDNFRIMFEVDIKDASLSLSQHAGKMRCLATSQPVEMGGEDINCDNKDILSSIIKSQTKINIGGKEAVKQSFFTTAGPTLQIYIPINDQSTLVIYTWGGWEYEAKIEPSISQSFISIFNQMLSTFRFIEETDETAGWKTYTNMEYGFEIKYPNDWYSYEKGFPNCLKNSKGIESTVLFSEEKFENCLSLDSLADDWFWFDISINFGQPEYSKERLEEKGVYPEGIYSMKCGMESVNKFEPIILNGLLANKTTGFAYDGMSRPPTTSIIFNNNGYAWRILYLNKCGGEPFNDNFEKMLSTFKFTN